MRLIDADHLTARVLGVNPSMHRNAASMKTAVLRGIGNSPTVCCDTCAYEKHVCMRKLAAGWDGTVIELDACSAWKAR
jgi:hypothetical protein